MRLRALKFSDQLIEKGVSKDQSFKVDFNNINLPLWQNAPKTVIPVKRTVAWKNLNVS
jgi:hypothetical protein